MHRVILIIAATMLTMVVMAHAASAFETWAQVIVTAKATIQHKLCDEYHRLNVECRGGAGDDPRTTEACNKRNTISKKLKARGMNEKVCQ
jgi:hypothetical protein